MIYDQNRLMSKVFKKFAVLGSVATYLYVASSVHAATPSPAPLVQPPSGAVSGDIAIGSIPTVFVNLLFSLAIILAVVYLIFGGIKWITSRGDKAGVESARKHIIAAIIGLVVVAGTFVIVNIIFQVLGTANPLKGNFTLPTLSNPNPTPNP